MNMRLILQPVLAICIGIVFLAGCGSESQTNADVLVRTPLASYRIGDTIRADVTNLSGSAIYYICFGQVRLQLVKQGNVAASWDVSAYEPCDWKTAILLGESHTFTVPAERLDSVALDSRFESGGEYRLLIDLYRDSACTVLLEKESDRMSNNFTVAQ